jgi:hypothetical protein
VGPDGGVRLACKKQSYPLYIILPRLVRMNKNFLLIGTAMAILVTASSQLTETFAQNATNMTAGIESKLKSVQPEGGLMRSTAPGDLVFVLVCPSDFDNVIEDCQIFQGSPVQ